MQELLAETTRKLIPVELLVPDPEQPRRCLDPASIQEIADSMRQHTQLCDLLVYPESTLDAALDNKAKLTGRFIVVDGHRRFSGAQILGWQQLRCTMLPRRPSSKELLTIQFSINEQREPLKPLEKLAVFKRFMTEFGMKQAELPSWFGISKSTVSNILRLQESSDEERELIEAGRLGVSAAAALCRMDADTRREALAEVRAGNVTRDELQGRSKRKPKKEGDIPALKSKRFVFELPDAKATIATGTGFTLVELLNLLDELTRVCKKARAEGLDITTLERVMRDKSQAKRTEMEPHHVS